MQLRCTFPDNICVQLGFLLIFASSFSKLWTCLHVKKTSSFMYWTPLTCLYYIHSHTSWSRWVTMTDSPNMALSEWPNWHTNNVFKKKASELRGRCPLWPPQSWVSLEFSCLLKHWVKEAICRTHSSNQWLRRNVTTSETQPTRELWVKVRPYFQNILSLVFSDSEQLFLL